LDKDFIAERGASRLQSVYQTLETLQFPFNILGIRTGSINQEGHKEIIKIFVSFPVFAVKNQF